MKRENSTASEGSFWTTIELLAGRERRRSTHEFEDAEVMAALTKELRRSKSFNHPHVRARMEMHMSSNLVRLTDKAYVKALIDRIYVVNEYNLHKRIADRQLDEMERLKMLILTGKTPLKACPPELFKHPVFVFWRMVNREIAKQSKKRADAYYNKLKGFKKIKPIHVEQEVIEEEVEETVYPTDEEILKHFLGEIETSRAAALEAGFRLSPREYAKLNYEAEDVKALKNMKTVEEMYRMADLIVGVPRTL